MKIRLFEKQDTEQVAQLFHETVREINRCDYSNNPFFNAWGLRSSENKPSLVEVKHSSIMRWRNYEMEEL
jgi:hypothetical protein